LKCGDLQNGLLWKLHVNRAKKKKVKKEEKEKEESGY
jgi:hypothetical protein